MAANQLTGIAKILDMGLKPARTAFERTQQWSALIATIASLLAGVTIMVTGFVLLHGLGDEYFTVQFATTEDRLAERIAQYAADPGTTLAFDTAQQAQWRGMAFAAIWGLIAAALFHVFWRRCWHVGPAIKPIVLKFIAAIPLAGAMIAITEKVITLLALTGSGQTIALRSSFGPVIVTLAWAQWVLAGFTVLLVIAMIVAAATGALQRRLRPDDPFVSTVAVPRSGGTGVCCSGGGIRAASFSLGALSALEQWPAAAGDTTVRPSRLADSMLGSANYLSGVSGGGYAASAWRIAAGTDNKRFADMPPLIGDPFDLSTKPGEPGEPTNLLEHVRRHRNFLATGRGGLPLAAIRYVLQTAFHMALLLGFIYVFTWPFGLLIRSWAVGAVDIVDVTTSNGQTDHKLEFVFGTQQWIPPLGWSIAAAIPWALRLGTKRGSVRSTLDGLTAGFAVLATGSAFVLIALPWMTANINIFPDDASGQLQVTGIYVTALTSVWQVGKRYLLRQAKYLGGVVLVVGLGLFVLRVVEEASLQGGWLGRLSTYIIVSGAVAAAFVLANPDKWSLNDFYRKRLAGTFATKLDENFHPTVLNEDQAPPLSAYIGAPGPEPIVCCAASRQEETETGVAALSMTFEPSQVSVHSWRAGDDATGTETTVKSLSHIEFKKRLPQGKQGDRLASLIGAAAISGAAVAPSMGRLNLKTTNALLAAFNARLGVWVPNPASEPLERMAAPRVINMFKEIFGVYGNTDPNVYATDGGHWENLGLVELIRKRCDLIIAIDTSGDLPGTYKALKNAIALAFLECEAKIDIDETEWEALIPDEDGLVPRNFVRGAIRYLDGTTGELLYVKAAVSRTTPLAVQRYAAGDRTFPNYSTANQMLTDAQLTNLFKLGFASMQTALRTRADTPSSAATTSASSRVSHAGP
jgi:hypothetical protein